MTLRSTRVPSVIWLAMAMGMGVLCTYASQSSCRAGEHAKAEDTKPAPDLTTARSAALAWIDASWNGDTHAAHQILVDSREQRETMAGSLRFCAALRSLESAAVKQFGEAGRRVTGYPDGSAKAVENQLEIKEDGDRATASMRDAVLPLRLRRIEGRWRVDISENAGDARFRRALESMVPAAEVAEDMAKEIAAGKYQTVEEARAALRERRSAQSRKAAK